MAEGLAVLGGVSSILQIVATVTKLAKSLNEVRESYDNVALNTTLVASQLSTIRAALEALHAWRVSDTVETEASIQLDKDLGLSLSCCAILITVIDGKLSESGYKPDMGTKQKIKYVWLEDILKEYISNLEGQVRALQLLLTIFQCRTATEQKRELAKAESRSIIEQVRAETMTLGFGDREMDDAISLLSHDPSVHLDVESILMKSPAYLRVYGASELPRKKPPPPPPPRRRPTPQSQSSAPPESALPTSTSPDVTSVSKSSSLKVPQSFPHPEVVSQPPSVPLRLKAQDQLRRPHSGHPNRDQRQTQGRINVWDFLGPDQESELQNAASMVMADSAPVFELPATPERMHFLKEVREDSPKGLIVSPPSLSPAQVEPNLPSHQFIESSGATSLKNGSDAAMHQDSMRLESKDFAKPDSIVEPATSLEGFRNQLDYAFEETRSSYASNEGLRLSFHPSEERDKHSLHSDDSHNIEVQGKAEMFDEEARSQILVEGHHVRNDGDQETDEDGEVLHEVISIHSSVDLYEASIKNVTLPMVSPAPSMSHSVPDQEVVEIKDTLTVDDALATKIDDLSSLNQHLASKTSESHFSKQRISLLQGNRIDVCKAAENPEQPDASSTERRESSERSHHALNTASQTLTTPLANSLEDSAADSSSQVIQQNEAPASPARDPPPPPIPTAVVLAPPCINPSPLDIAAGTSRTSTASTGRDSSIFDTSSTVSSSRLSADNATTLTIPNSVPITMTTSGTVNTSTKARDQAQASLRRLQIDLTAAKARGDSQAAQDSLQRSIEVIRHTYLTPSVTVETTKSPSRTRFRRLSSLAGSAKSLALSDAAAAGDLVAVRSLLDGKVNADARGNNFMTPLMRAAVNGHVQCLDILKQHGADAFSVDAKGRNVLHLSVAANRVAVVQWLLNAYPLPRPQQLKHRASILSKAEGLISRLPKNLRETSDSEGSKPLHIAVRTDQGGMMKVLLAAGADIESKNNWGRTPLHQTIISNRRDCFDILLRSGASMNAVDPGSMTPLHWAAMKGHTGMIETLLAAGADTFKFDHSGYQPIHHAASAGQILGVKLLMGESKDPSIRTKAGESLLHIACTIKQPELATYLLESGIEVNSWTAPQATLLNALSKFKVPLSSLTPLHYACCRGDYEMIVLLLDHGAWINAGTPEGVTPLMMATESEDTNTVNLLLTRGSKVNASMPGTLTTALHIACRRGDLETVQQLCRSHANDSARLNDGGGYPGRTPALEASVKCTDVVKRRAILEYFRIINRNRQIQAQENARRQVGLGQDLYGTVGQANMTTPTKHLGPMQPVSYAPWGQHDYGQSQGIPSGFQRPPAATYPPWTQQPPEQPPPQWYDPNNLTHVESPPPYQPGSSVPTQLAAQAPVHRPGIDTNAEVTNV